ncbi:MAG: YdeI/OmpD-associated family protein [Planctomycetota bacterium]
MDRGIRFETEVVKHAVGTLNYRVVFLDERFHEALPLREHPRLRVRGEVNGVAFDGAWQPVRGRWYLMLGKRLLKSAGVDVGDRVLVAFRVVDQASVEVPDELRRALAANDAALRSWGKLTAGKQRAFAHRVSSAVRAETRAIRVEEVIDALVSGEI